MNTVSGKASQGLSPILGSLNWQGSHAVQGFDQLLLSLSNYDEGRFLAETIDEFW